LPNSDHDSAWRGCYSLLTPLPLSLHLGGRPQAASLVRGLRPRNAPSPTTSRRSEWVGNMKLASRGDPHFPHRALVGPECELAQARQAGRIPHGSKVPCDARQDPATESRTVHFVIPNQDRAQKVATQNMTHNWQLYKLFLLPDRCWDPTVSVRVQAHQSTSVSKHSWSRSIWTQKKFICFRLRVGTCHSNPQEHHHGESLAISRKRSWTLVQCSRTPVQRPLNLIQGSGNS